MKYFIVILFILTGYIGQAQNTPVLKDQHDKPQNIVWFLDSVKISLDDNRFKYIMPTDFKHIKVEKNATYPDGAIYVTLINHNRLAELMNDKLITLQQLATEAKIKFGDKALYFINDVLVTDTAGVSIPSNYVKKIAIIKAVDMPYFKTAMPDVVLLKISTQDPQTNVKGTASDWRQSPTP